MGDGEGANANGVGDDEDLAAWRPWPPVRTTLSPTPRPSPAPAARFPGRTSAPPANQANPRTPTPRLPCRRGGSSGRTRHRFTDLQHCLSSADATMAIYTGNPIGSLTKIESDDDGCGVPSRLNSGLRPASRTTSPWTARMPSKHRHPGLGGGHRPHRGQVRSGHGDRPRDRLRNRLHRRLPAGPGVSLTANPATGFILSGWSGSCDGGRCRPSEMNTTKDVTAVFHPGAICMCPRTTSPCRRRGPASHGGHIRGRRHRRHRQGDKQ